MYNLTTSVVHVVVQSVYSGIPIFRTSKGNETWFEKFEWFEKSEGKLRGEKRHFGSGFREISKKMRVREIGIPNYVCYFSFS